MAYQTVTYAASLTYAAQPVAPLAESSPNLTDGLAAFLLRVAAYCQGCLASLPRMQSFCEPLAISPGGFQEDAQGNVQAAVKQSLTVMDAALDGTSGPLVKVTMNRAFSRRLRWLIKRGRVQRSGRLRVCDAATEARCNLTPGQMSEYYIRVYRQNRTVIYGLNRGGRIQNKGGVMSLGVAGESGVLLCPD